MSYFLGTMTHPDGKGSGLHVVANFAFLTRLIDAGQVLVSGPVSELRNRAGFIIMTVGSIMEAHELIAQDSFVIEGLIDEITILEWTSMFGRYRCASHLFQNYGKVLSDQPFIFDNKNVATS